MEPVHVLVSEHRIIERVLGALERFTSDALGRDADPRPELRRFIQFFTEYADRLHHAKEETLLFEQMRSHGFSPDHGPVASLLDEHKVCRALLTVMRCAVEKPHAFADSDRELALGAAIRYVRLLRDHIDREDHVLYPLAAAHLSPGALEGLAADSLELERTSAERSRALVALAEQLVRRWA